MADSSLLTVLKAYVGFDADCASRLQALICADGALSRAASWIDFTRPSSRTPVRARSSRTKLRSSASALPCYHWLEGLFTGPYDAAYYEKRAQIGRMHVKVGLEQRYMLGAMNVIRIELHRAVSDSAPDGLGIFEDHSVIDQICDLELAIMLETYREDYVLKKTAEAESLAVMGRLTAGLAHEVRNPLNAAKLQLDVLRRTASKVEDASTRRKIERRTNVVQDELRRLSILARRFPELGAHTEDGAYPLQCQHAARGSLGAVAARDRVAGNRIHRRFSIRIPAFCLPSAIASNRSSTTSSPMRSKRWPAPISPAFRSQAACEATTNGKSR